MFPMRTVRLGNAFITESNIFPFAKFSEIICNYLLNIFKNNKIEGKVKAFCADNANTNFEGVARKRENNVFSKMESILNRNLIGVGCAAHITNNAIQRAADLLPIDVENIIQKIYGHFYIYTIRVNNLKELCEEAETECQQILGYWKEL